LHPQEVCPEAQAYPRTGEEQKEAAVAAWRIVVGVAWLAAVVRGLVAVAWLVAAARGLAVELLLPLVLESHVWAINYIYIYIYVLIMHNYMILMHTTTCTK
jgi:hypothetical protein